MSYLVHINIDQLEYNAKLINETGIIRGSIQRATKLIFAGKTKKAIKIINNIDNKIETILKDMSYRGELKRFIEKNFSKLHTKWHKLKLLLIKYESNHSKKIKQKIIDLSERCWNIADDVVLNTQIMTQYKISGIKIFYIILGINILSAILVILLVYLYIKKRLEYESSHDSLTDIYNKRAFEEILESLIANAKRYSRPLSIIIFDIDNFKSINDEFGHKTGDKVLSKLANIIKSSIRKGDIFCRVGGEEFVILCPETDEKSAFKVAEKIRKLVERTAFSDVGKITISLGIAEYKNNQTKEDFFKSADTAMYFAKNSGKNRSEIYNEKIIKSKIFSRVC